VLVGAAITWYRLRVRSLAHQLTVRFEERLAERTRIAQELHDTLLQGFVSASMQLHVAADRVADDSPAKQPIARVLELMSRVIDEGRNAVRGLRTPIGAAADLQERFAAIPAELGEEHAATYRVIVEGRPRPLHPFAGDDVLRIGREAVVNALRHAAATAIEVELDYAASHLQVIVRDNGCGIDERVLESGRDGHWGLPGMRERAERIGAKLKVWTREGAGTEVVLVVPADVAFASGVKGSSTGE
jgi:signal transduction histidine kinase